MPDDRGEMGGSGTDRADGRIGLDAAVSLRDGAGETSLFRGLRLRLCVRFRRLISDSGERDRDRWLLLVLVVVGEISDVIKPRPQSAPVEGGGQRVSECA